MKLDERKPETVLAEGEGWHFPSRAGHSPDFILINNNNYDDDDDDDDDNNDDDHDGDEDDDVMIDGSVVWWMIKTVLVILRFIRSLKGVKRSTAVLPLTNNTGII